MNQTDFVKESADLKAKTEFINSFHKIIIDMLTNISNNPKIQHRYDIDLFENNEAKQQLLPHFTKAANTELYNMGQIVRSIIKTYELYNTIEAAETMQRLEKWLDKVLEDSENVR